MSHSAESVVDGYYADVPGGTSKLLGREIGGYTIRRCIGEGGMGAVYEAVHKTPGKRAAVKVLSALRSEGEKAADGMRRLEDEAKVLCSLRHTNLVELYDWGTLADGTTYILMEYLQGRSLKEYQQQCGGKVPLAQALEIARQLSDALKSMHEASVVHRDLTPSNVFICDDPAARSGQRVKILDFGIAKLRSRQEARTQTGECIGTPRYMAPEQCESSTSVDDRADVYALGMLLFEMLTGESPYLVPISTPLKWMNAHISQRPRLLNCVWKKAPPHLVRLVAAMLDKIPEQRPSAAEVLAVLANGAQLRRPVRLSRMLPAAGVGLGVLALGAAASFYSAHRDRDRSWVGAADVAALAARAPRGMVLLPGAQRFVMGSTLQETEAAFAMCEELKPPSGCHRDLFERELGERHVTLSPFFLDQYEVTNSQYADFLNRVPIPIEVGNDSLGVPRYVRRVNPGKPGTLLLDLFSKNGTGSGLVFKDESYFPRPGFERLPVILVSYQGARMYCKHHGKDLPTEAQWEHAAQPPATQPGRLHVLATAASNGPLPCGAALLMRTAREPCGSLHLRTPAPVGSYPMDRSAHGVFDMTGNVSEWVRDRFVAPYPDCGACIDPEAPQAEAEQTAAETTRVFRGGSINLISVDARTHSRSRRSESSVSPDIGFRCAAVATQGK